jgi:Anti-sigma-K factor rskA
VTPGQPQSIDRLHDLLAQQVVEGVSPAERAELDQLLVKWPHVGEDDFELTAALIEAATLPSTIPTLTPAMTRRIEADALAHFQPIRPKRKSAQSTFAWAGWGVAACLAITTVTLAWQWKRTSTPEVTKVFPLPDQRQQLLDGGAKRFDITPVKSKIRGDVVWDGGSQKGYLRVQGLAVNNPKQKQYQLWIVDRGRTHKEPVDGGVFDVANSGEMIVPIRSPLTILDPAAFAITEEPAGGVVVSERGGRGDFALVMTDAKP